MYVDVDGAESLARRLERFQRASVFSEVADTVKPALLTALRLAAPKKTGRLADHIWIHRATSIDVNASVELIATTDVPYAPFVLHGTRPHQIVPKVKQALHWWDATGGDMFATVVNHPGTKPNRFPHRVWEAMREPITDELVAQVVLKLRDPL